MTGRRDGEMVTETRRRGVSEKERVPFRRDGEDRQGEGTERVIVRRDGEGC